MTVLFLAWRERQRRWWPVGCLSERPAGSPSGRLYVFRYTKGALEAQVAGFTTLPGFPEIDATYVSSELFPLFRNRLMPSDRSDFGVFLRWLDLPPGETDPLVLLGRSGGRRETDMFEVFSVPEQDGEGRYRMSFFIHGMSHRTEEQAAAASGLAVGDRLVLRPEPENPGHSGALQVLTSDHIHIGFVPRYLCPDISVLTDDVSVTVQRVNHPPAPMQFRVLARFEAAWPQAFRPFNSEAFQPSAAGDPAPRVEADRRLSSR
jgi:hypothetical protein